MQIAIALFHVVTPTGRHHIRPLVSSPTTSGNHVINRVRMFAAVSAAKSISHEYGSPGDRWRSSTIRDTRNMEKSDDARYFEVQRGRVQDLGILAQCNRFGTAVDQEQRGSS